ncbi:MMPL family transporter [Nocardioides albus]|uniref:RND superfamily putative drug exporter n=1 Tax=Nocardioides albus TaxID=1841 RepID=A0A7W5F7A7_9ACTN|nr:MMPL family transporter [Nocardioides albus]MBB3087954.1 RND superfamily putative drug exporter [Nocardioides albus]GGU21558.1 multidrug RND transporter [Nocardioides albus]
MAKLLYRLGKTAYRRWPIFVAIWLIVIIGIGAVATTMSKPMSTTFSMPGLESVEAAEELPEIMGTEGGSVLDAASIEVVVAAPEGETLTTPENQKAVADLVADLAALDDVPDQISYIWTPEQAKAAAPAYAEMMSAESGQQVPTEQAEQMLLGQLQAQPTLSEDGRIGLISTEFEDVEVADVTPAMQEEVTDVVEQAAEDTGLQVEVRGQGMQVMEMGSASAELIGIALALLILLLTFGSFVAAGLPILTAGFGVAIGTLGITALTAFTEVSSTTPMLATMIGLAVGIDYALFILARYRSELDHTDDREEAIGIAVGTAGSAVVFAGLTVVIALAALSVVGIPFLTAMGIGAAVTVVVAVLVALTLLPALLGLFKSKAFGLSVRRYRPKREANGRVLNNGVRWARFIGKAPIAWALIVIIGLGALAIPFKDLHLGMPSDSTAPEDSSRRQAVELVVDGFGPGRLDPMMLVVDARDMPGDQAEKQAAYAEVAEWAGSMDGVAKVVPPSGNENGAVILIEPETAPEDEATDELLAELREGEGALEEQTGADLAVTGTSAIMSDISEKLNDALLPYLAIVIGLAFILLMLVFRSILVPLTATLGFLLSVLATLGVTVAVFQEGAFGIFDGQPIVSFMPIFLIGLVFGLAMDYQVFLVTRIREAHVHGASYKEAVVDGFRNSARVVTAAALIMTAVFAGFIMMDDPIIKSMGFALAAAVIFDAFIVRMLLIPTLMYLMKEKAWWLPKWLDRILPNVDVEGESLERHYLADHYADDPREPELVKS